jgi:hypothetical protein
VKPAFMFWGQPPARKPAGLLRGAVVAPLDVDHGVKAAAHRVRLDPAHLLRATKAVVAGVGITSVPHRFPGEVLPSALD